MLTSNRVMASMRAKGLYYQPMSVLYPQIMWQMVKWPFLNSACHRDKSCEKLKERSSFRLISERFSSDLPKQLFASEAEVKGDFFLPLGWLVESNKEGTKRATRYVCLLNISTDPLSLWLMFDYLIKDEKRQTIKIPDLSYVYDDDIYKPSPRFYHMTNAKDTIGDYDLLLVYKNVADWDPLGKDIGTTINSSLLENPSHSFHLGSSTQAIGVIPPKSLLDHVTQSF